MSNAVQPSSPLRSDLYRRAQNGLIIGGKIMLLQAPILTALNRVSVVCCYSNLSTVKSVKAIYLGKVDGLINPSWLYFFKGGIGHLVKETSRLGFKTFGIMGKPVLDRHYQNQPLGKFKADLAFAGGLSVGEVVINPADTVRTMWQAGKRWSSIKKGTRFSHLYKGAGANGVRQFGIWLGFPLSERVWSTVVEKTTSIDPHDISGIVLKSIPQSYQITAPVWLLERLKNELQYHPDLITQEQRTSRYSAAFSRIRRTQGWGGLWRGFAPKVGGTTVLVIGADYLLEEGRKAQKV